MPKAGSRVVFGAGGDRDRGKRPLMGEVATRLADRVYVTDDNPRSEPPAAIRRAILAAAPARSRSATAARRSRRRSPSCARGDLLVIAGKGHETGQIIGNTTLALRRRRGGARDALPAGLGR